MSVVSQFITVASFSFSDVEDSLVEAKELVRGPRTDQTAPLSLPFLSDVARSSDLVDLVWRVKCSSFLPLCVCRERQAHRWDAQFCTIAFGLALFNESFYKLQPLRCGCSLWILEANRLRFHSGLICSAKRKKVNPADIL